nr:ABC transporter permease [Rubellimicrobium arenae]
MSLATAAGCLALALPLAHWLARRAGRARRVLTAIVLLPLACGALLPTLGLVHLLGPLGVVNGTLRGLGLIASPLPLLGTQLGIVIGLIQAFLPFAVLPILAVLDRTPPVIEEAAITLGATPARLWVRIILPLAWPGLLAGGLLVFCSALTAFVTPQIVGQGKVATFAMLAYQQALQVLDWPFASALAVTMLAALALAAVVTFSLARLRP